MIARLTGSVLAAGQPAEEVLAEGLAAGGLLDTVLDILSWAFLGSGSLVLALSALSILRMPTFYTRLHAASVNETLGPGLILAGLLLQVDGRWDVAAKLVLIFWFLVLTGPLAGHAIGKAAFHAGLKPGQYKKRLQAREDAS